MLTFLLAVDVDSFLYALVVRICFLVWIGGVKCSLLESVYLYVYT